MKKDCKWFRTRSSTNDSESVRQTRIFFVQVRKHPIWDGFDVLCTKAILNVASDHTDRVATSAPPTFGSGYPNVVRPNVGPN